MLRREMSWAAGVGLVAVFVLGGCDGGGNGGGGTGSIAFDLDSSPAAYSGVAGAVYEISPDITVIAALASASSQYPSISLIVPGGDAGTFTEADGVMVTYAESATSAFFAMMMAPGTSCTVTITDYGPVGGLVEGTFSAVVSDGTSTLTISNGTFSVVRTPDA